ncbi:hypothetical protein H2248_004260 [Termitomyces sp. 'cryptogamus']|nr:hypothetical protein H2248_004260 [Termitomyces sp. 'cryptogamus']
MNNYNKIQVRLLDASRQLMKAMGVIRKYSRYLTDDEFEEAMRQCEDAMQKVAESLKEDAACKTFIVEIKKYRESKEKAQYKVVSSHVIMANVISVSTREKRREEKRIDEAGNILRLQRVDELERILMQTPCFDGATLIHHLRQVPLPPPNSSPSPSGNEASNPFKDPTSASDLNSVAGGDSDAGDLSLQCA